MEKQQERKAVIRPDIDCLSKCNDSSSISYTKYLRHKVFTCFVFFFPGIFLHADVPINFMLNLFTYKRIFSFVFRSIFTQNVAPVILNAHIGGCFQRHSLCLCINGFCSFNLRSSKTDTGMVLKIAASTKSLTYFGVELHSFFTRCHQKDRYTYCIWN